MIHIGKIIKQVVSEKKYPIHQLAAKINRTRAVIYNIYERKSVDTDLLYNISKVLNHDFFKYYQDVGLEDNGELDEALEGYNLSQKSINELKLELKNAKDELEKYKSEFQVIQNENKLLHDLAEAQKNTIDVLKKGQQVQTENNPG